MPELGYFVLGQYNFTCDICGRGFKSSAMRKRWDGAITCNEGTCWEIRQPQDFVRGVRDDQSVHLARPRILPSTTALLWYSTSGPFAWLNTARELTLWTNQ